MRSLKNLALHCACLLSLALTAATVSHSWRSPNQSLFRPSQGNVTASAVNQYLEEGDSLIVDARPSTSFDYAHIPGAVSIPADGEVPPNVLAQALQKARTIVYCDGPGCDASQRVAEKLRMAGVPSIIVFAGGFQDWTNSGLPSEGRREKNK